MAIRLGVLYQACRRRLHDTIGRDCGATPDLDCRMIISHVLDLPNHAPITANYFLVDNEKHRIIDALLERRIRGEPVARLIGWREFWGLRFDLSQQTLIPRPETEIIVETVLSWIREEAHEKAPLKIADFGTGSGAILIALLLELPNACGFGIDICTDALEQAKKNAAHHQVADRVCFSQRDFGAALEKTFDVIVSNPPYVREGEAQYLGPSVDKFDPPLALFGGPSGLDAYDQLLPPCFSALRNGGLCVLEHGFDQQDAVASRAEHAGFHSISRLVDLSGKPRALKLRKQ